VRNLIAVSLGDAFESIEELGGFGSGALIQGSVEQGAKFLSPMDGCHLRGVEPGAICCAEAVFVKSNPLSLSRA